MTRASPQAPPGERILSVDATRGTLMLLSCLAHFAWGIHGPYPDLSGALAGIGMIATPSFLMVSGAMVGMLCALPRRAGSDLRSQLFNRGLFLMTVGHFLISLSEAHSNGGLWKTLPGVSVVDEIGLCTLIAAFLVPKLADLAICRRIAWGAVIVLALSWIADLLWIPTSDTGLAIKNILIGGNIDSPHIGMYTAPTLQYMAIYALGLPLGNLFAAYRAGKVESPTLIRRFTLIGGLLVGVSCVIRLGRYAIDHVAAFHAMPHESLDLTLKVTAKTPPSPAYVMFYCGVGLLLLATAFWTAQRRGAIGLAVLRWIATIGRASLFVFVLQYFLYWTLPDLMGITPNPLSIGLFFGNIALMYGAAVVWGRIHGNRYLTFGIKLGS